MARTRQPQHPPAAKAKPFDLATRFAADTAVVTIHDPADLSAQRDTGLRVEISSLYSDAARQAAQAAVAKLPDGADAAQVDFTESLFEQVVAVTKRWWDTHGAPDALLIAGELVPCTPEHVRRVYRDPRTAWLYTQVRTAYLDLGRFFPTPKASS